MPFSPQSYTGQGIVQQTERSRVGEIFGQGLAGLGEGLGKGIEKFQENRAEAKELRSSLPALAKFMPKEERDEFLAQVEQTDLPGLRGLRRKVLEFGEMQLQQERLAEARQKREAVEQEGRFYQDLVSMYTPQEKPVDFAPQISAKEQALAAAQQEDQGFRPEFAYFKGAEQGFSPIKEESELGRYIPSEATSGVFRTPAADQFQPSSQFQMFESGQAKNAMMRQKPKEPEGRFLDRFQPFQQPAQEQVYKPAPTEGDAMGPAELPGPSEEVRQAAKDLELLKVAQEKGETRLENADEMRNRVAKEMPKLLEENPLMAKTAYELLYDQSDKLTFDQKLKLQEHLDKKQALFIPSRGGYAGDAASAKEMRSMDLANNQVQSGVSRLLEILDTPGKRTNYDLKREADTIVGLLTGALRVPITGPGAFSEPERKLIEGLIPNPTDFFRMDSRTRTSLETLASRIAESTNSYAVSIGLGGSQTQQSQGPRRVIRDNSGKIVTQ